MARIGRTISWFNTLYTTWWNRTRYQTLEQTSTRTEYTQTFLYSPRSNVDSHHSGIFFLQRRVTVGSLIAMGDEQGQSLRGTTRYLGFTFVGQLRVIEERQAKTGIWNAISRKMKSNIHFIQHQGQAPYGVSMECWWSSCNGQVKRAKITYHHELCGRCWTMCAWACESDCGQWQASMMLAMRRCARWSFQVIELNFVPHCVVGIW